MKTLLFLYVLCFGNSPDMCSVMYKGFDTEAELIATAKQGPNALIDSPFPVYMLDLKKDQMVRLVRKETDLSVNKLPGGLITGEY